MGSIGGAELIVLGLVAFMAVPTLFALIDILRTPPEVWQRSGHQQMVWLVAVLFGGILGAIAFWVIAKPKLRP